MSTDTLRLEGKPGTGKVAPGKVTPLKNVKARPELTQQLKVSQATPHTPDIPEWKGEFPFPKDITYTDNPDGDLIADLQMNIVTSGSAKPTGRKWGVVQAQGGTANVPIFKADVVKTKEGCKITKAKYFLKLEMGLVFYNSPAWETLWNSGMEELTGRYGLTPEERKYWAFQHEMDHFRAWSEYFRFMLKHIFAALNANFEDEKLALIRIDELNYNSSENFIVAAQRSHAFDEYRGAPLMGNKYSTFDFPESDCYRWHQSGKLLPKSFNQINSILLSIKDIDKEMFE